MAKVQKNSSVKSGASVTPTVGGNAAPTTSAGAAAEQRADPARQSGTTPSPEQIAKRAYELYLARGGAHGNDREDWLQAEQELRGGKH